LQVAKVEPAVGYDRYGPGFVVYFAECFGELCDDLQGFGIGFDQKEIAFVVHAQKMAVHVESCAPAELARAPFLRAVIETDALEISSVLIALAGIAMDETVDDKWIGMM